MTQRAQFKKTHVVSSVPIYQYHPNILISQYPNILISHAPNSMTHLLRSDSEHPDFQSLVRLLDQDLAIRDGEEHAFYAQFNKVDKIKEVVLLFDHGVALACGAIRQFSADAVEVKRMFVLPEQRGKGLAGQVLAELESWSRELGFERCILETGKKQPEAIRLYEKSGYRIIPNYGQYAGVENSVCMEKILD